MSDSAAGGGPRWRWTPHSTNTAKSPLVQKLRITLSSSGSTEKTLPIQVTLDSDFQEANVTNTIVNKAFSLELGQS